MSTTILPLFPLRDVVLFPGMLLPLHIFEPRYVKMIERQLSTDRRFGVALLTGGDEVGGPATAEAIGTTALIRDCRELESARYLVLSVGVERFRVVRSWEQDELLMGEIEPLADQSFEENLDPLCAELRRLADEHRRLMGSVLGTPVEPAEWPAAPIELSFALAAMLQLDAPIRQDLLATTDTGWRLRLLQRLVSEQVTVLGARLEVQAEADRVVSTNGHLPAKYLEPPAGES